MALECNIDAKGKVARLTGGIAAVAAGALLLGVVASGTISGSFWWITSVGAVAGGAFSIFEARAGWCVVRALGIKTPL